MKRIIALLLTIALLSTGCGRATSVNTGSAQSSKEIEITVEKRGAEESKDVSSEIRINKYKNVIPEFEGMGDPKLLRYVEDNIYTELVRELNSDGYFVENVSAMYLSEEYLEELEFNSRENVYFGYRLDELDEVFEGTRYVFALGQNNETVVLPFEAYDDTYQQIIKNVAIGAGVILICVTVSVVTCGAGAPAVSMIFAAGAKTGAAMALSSAAIGGAASTIITGVQTHDMDKAIKAGLLAGSEGFKWGAITGAVAGGATEGVKYVKAIKALKGVALNGITTQEAAVIQMESGLPIKIIKQFQSMEEYKIYKEAGLAAKMIKGELALTQDIDLTIKSTVADGTKVSNLERMARGLAPVDSTGASYQLHHIGQKADATLAVLTEGQHRAYGKILHIAGKESEIDRVTFDLIRKAFWKAYAAAYR